MDTTVSIVYIRLGAYEDYHEAVVFATTDHDYATKWVERANGIIDRHRDRIRGWYYEHEIDDDVEYPAPYLGEYIMYHHPVAAVKQTQLRRTKKRRNEEIGRFHN